MTRAQALTIVAVEIARHVPNLAVLVEFLETAGVKRLAARLRELISSRPVEIGGAVKPDPAIWTKGRVK